ncbi:unnamed protein product [Ilex paraguariensis]|uniref:Two-component response regulator n=1 Tax=Ilex paraguariensis TaxID=185542 RepID=A0ABC8TL75_9AQUA
MTVEETRGSFGVEDENNDKFPVGMRVLAVDDDPTCLKLLEGLLRKCQYQVTTTSQARMAHMMLRENKNRFDLVISDVHMPDMDGFKLLELVGLEMDLPVIRNSDPKLVMKGVTHGACDYLVKPVRLEELRNIWQHVLRRKKFDSKSQNNSTTQDKAHQGSEGPAPTGNEDQNGKLNRKRKDEEEEGEDNGHENEDPSAQKKPRVVWSIELHRKFVAAVHQLGIEKAVPKRILDLMNVEGLTRENVASHLQKYRLYLKRISSVATQQANMVAILGGKDSSYVNIGSLDGLRDLQTLAGPGRLSNPAATSYPPSGMLNRLNSPAAVGLHTFTSSALIQPSHAQNLSNSIDTIGKFQLNSPAAVGLHTFTSSVLIQPSHAQNFSNSIDTIGKFQSVVSPANQNAYKLQENKCTSHIRDFNPIDDPKIFAAGNTFTDTRVVVGSSKNPLISAPSNQLMLRGNSQQTQTGGGFQSHYSLKMDSLNSEFFTVGVSGSANFLDQGRCTANLQSAFQSSQFPLNSLPLNESFNHDQLPPNSMRDNNSLVCPPIQNSPLYFSSTTTASAPLEDSRGEMQCQEGLVSDVTQNVNQALSQRWGGHKQDYTHNSNNIFSSFNSLAPANGVLAPSSQVMDLQNGVCNRKLDVSFVGQSNGVGSTLVQQSEVVRSTMDSTMRSNEDYFLEHTKLPGGVISNSYDSLDDLMNAMIKRGHDGTVLMDGEFGFDAYSFGSCM